MTKSEIRRQNKMTRNQLSDNLVNEYSMRIHERLYGLQEFVECNMLFTYISFGREVNTHDIIRKALQMNKDVYIPRVENKELNFYKINEFDCLIRSGFGILEPDVNIHPKYDFSLKGNDKRLMLLPGLAFDKAGNRVGYGAGYYDRYLGRYPHDLWVKIALAYNFQITERLKVNVYDVPADYIITDEKLFICKE